MEGAGWVTDVDSGSPQRTRGMRGPLQNSKCAKGNLKGIDGHCDTIRGHGAKEGSGMQAGSLEGIRMEYGCPWEAGDLMEAP